MTKIYFCHWGVGFVWRWLIRSIFGRKSLLQRGQGMCKADPNWEVLYVLDTCLLKVSHHRFYEEMPFKMVLGRLFPGGIGNSTLLKRFLQCVFIS